MIIVILLLLLIIVVVCYWKVFVKRILQGEKRAITSTAVPNVGLLIRYFPLNGEELRAVLAAAFFIPFLFALALADCPGGWLRIFVTGMGFIFAVLFSRQILPRTSLLVMFVTAILILWRVFQGGNMC